MQKRHATNTGYFSATAALSLAQVSKRKLKVAMRVKWGSETSETKSGLPESRPPQLSFLTSEHLLSKGYPSPLLQDYWGQRNQHTQRTMLKTKGKTNTKGWRKDFQLHAKETSHLMTRHHQKRRVCVLSKNHAMNTAVSFKNTSFIGINA